MEEDTWVSCCFDGWRQVFPLVEGNRDVSGCWSLLTLAATILRIERPKRAGGEGDGASTHARAQRVRKNNAGVSDGSVRLGQGDESSHPFCLRFNFRNGFGGELA